MNINGIEIDNVPDFTNMPYVPSASRRKMIVLNDEQETWLRRWYPIITNVEIMELTGLTIGRVRMFAVKYGLRKSKEGIARGNHIARIKMVQTCRSNGYYTSLHSCGMHPNSIAAIKKVRQEIHDGIRESTIAHLRRTDPERYQQWRKGIGERFRKTIKKERARLAFGLPQKTRMKNVVLQPFSISQVSYRYSARKRGYLLADDCSEGTGERYVIYYDENTKRSARFEKNCEKDGFRFVAISPLS